MTNALFSLGAAWTGGAWYTGKHFQRRSPDLVNDANTRLQSAFPHSGLHFAAINYRRGVFTSHVDVVVQSDGSTGDNKLLSLVAETRFSYGGNTVSKITPAAIDFQNNQTIIRASGWTFDVDEDGDSDKLKVSVGIDSLVLSWLNKWRQREQLTVHNFTMDNDIYNGKQGYSIGDNTLNA